MCGDCLQGPWLKIIGHRVTQLSVCGDFAGALAENFRAQGYSTVCVWRLFAGALALIACCNIELQLPPSQDCPIDRQLLGGGGKLERRRKELDAVFCPEVSST
jgi:hypothetical protein